MSLPRRAFFGVEQPEPEAEQAQIPGASAARFDGPKGKGRMRTCRHCGERFRSFFGKPGYVDECMECVGQPHAFAAEPKSRFFLNIWSSEAFTSHVVPVDSDVLTGVDAGLFCIICREP